MSADSKPNLQTMTSMDRQFDDLLSHAAQHLQRQAAADKRAKGNNSEERKLGAQRDLRFSTSGATGQW
jgi:hypothetical protein